MWLRSRMMAEVDDDGSRRLMCQKSMLDVPIVTRGGDDMRVQCQGDSKAAGHDGASATHQAGRLIDASVARQASKRREHRSMNACGLAAVLAGAWVSLLLKVASSSYPARVGKVDPLLPRRTRARSEMPGAWRRIAPAATAGLLRHRPQAGIALIGRRHSQPRTTSATA
jgi:hypothetical protein